MGFLDANISVFKGYFQFSGRASRPEYWWFFLVYAVLGCAALAFDAWSIRQTLEAQGGNPSALQNLNMFSLVSVYYFLATFFPRMCVTVRRLQDAGLTGYLFAVYFVPVVGGIVISALAVLPSEPCTNRHGQQHRRPRLGQKPRKTGAGTRKHDPMQGYAVLSKINVPPSPEIKAARKAEVRALYEARVLGKVPVAAE